MADAPAPRDALRDLPPYVGGRASVKGRSKVFKLSANENPLGAGAAAKKAYRTLGDLSLYPDGAATELRAALAAHNGLDGGRIVCGNGSGDLLHLLAQAYLRAGDEALHTAHGFLLYKLAIRAAGAMPVAVPERDLTADVDALLAAITDKTRMVFLANPNNPTGTMIDAAAVETLHRGLPPHVLLVLDGAYAEYVEADLGDFALVDNAENVVATRSFSKAYGLAGLRLGWAYCPPAIADVLNRLRAPFNANGAAQRAAIAALGDTAHIARSRTHNRRWRERLVQRLGGLGLDVRGGHANFVLVDFGDAETAKAADAFMCERGVIPRVLTAYDLPSALRLSIGTPAANRAAIAALEAFVKSR